MSLNILSIDLQGSVAYSVGYVANWRRFEKSHTKVSIDCQLLYDRLVPAMARRRSPGGVHTLLGL